MRYSRLWLFVIVSLGICLMSRSSHGTMTGYDLQQQCTATLRAVTAAPQERERTASLNATPCLDYVRGLDDGITLLALSLQRYGMAADLTLHELKGYCLPRILPAGVLAHTIVDFLQQHPKKLENDPSLIVYEALLRAFPCTDQRQKTK